MLSVNNLSSEFLKYLLDSSKNSIIAQYPQAKSAVLKNYDFYFDSSCVLYSLVSYWTQKDYPNIGDSTEYAFNMNISPHVIQQTGLMTPKEKETFQVKEKEIETILEGSPFEGDPMFQE